MKNSIEKLVRYRLHVTPKVGYDFSGVLLHAERRREGWLTFTDVVVYPDEAEPKRLAGDTLFAITDVHFVQKLPPHVDH